MAFRDPLTGEIISAKQAWKNKNKKENKKNVKSLVWKKFSFISPSPKIYLYYWIILSHKEDSIDVEMECMYKEERGKKIRTNLFLWDVKIIDD